jgi:hypothetical protein
LFFGIGKMMLVGQKRKKNLIEEKFYFEKKKKKENLILFQTSWLEAHDDGNKQQMSDKKLNSKYRFLYVFQKRLLYFVLDNEIKTRKSARQKD